MYGYNDCNIIVVSLGREKYTYTMVTVAWMDIIGEEMVSFSWQIITDPFYDSVTLTVFL